MSPVLRRAAPTCAALVAVAGGLTGCGGHDDKAVTPVKPAPVALTADGAPHDLSIGVVVSLTSAPGQGSDWAQAAEGAQIAAYRYGLGNVTVRLQTADDKGTADGAAKAVRSLVHQHVAGIVLATEGSHIKGALTAAAKAHVAVLLPYDSGTTSLPDDAWRTGPDSKEVSATLAAAVKDRGLDRPAVVDAGGGTPSGLSPVATYTFRPGDDAGRLAKKIARRTHTARPVDSVVVSGPAGQQAAVVQALQGAALGDLPVFLTPDAQSPSFATSLSSDGGTLSGDLTTVGTNAGDIAAMSPDRSGGALSAYFAGLRAAASDTKTKDFFDGKPFASVADEADTRSHDAVVALVNAAAKAKSADPAAVLQALSGLKLDLDSGLAGPTLDFGSHSALSSSDTVALNATTRGPGLRPVEATPPAQLYWFKAPKAE